MLKLRRSARVLAMMLVVLMLAASALLVFADAAPLAAPAANDPLIKDEIVLSQDEVNIINLKGTLDVSFIDDPTFSVKKIVVRIGANELGSQVKNLPYDEDGNVDFDIEVNPAIALEYNNYVPVVISYSYTNANGEVEVAEIVYYTGVITYDYDSGILGAPNGTDYLSVNGWTALNTPYAPTDAKGFDDEAPSISVAYEDTYISFAINTEPVEEIPEIDTEAPYLKDMTDKSFTFITVPGFEYLVLDISKGVDATHKEYLFGDDAWFLADSDEAVIEVLVAGGIYTVWVRTPAGTTAEEKLASKPLCLGRVSVIDEDEYAELNAFLTKYHEVTVIKGNNLYTPETPVVTASPADTKELIILYNVLAPATKKLIVVAEKAEYLVISDYLANHQEMVYDDLADLRDKYAEADLDKKLNAAFDAFRALKFNAVQAEMFKDFDDIILRKKIDLALIKVKALTEGGVVDVEKLLADYTDLHYGENGLVKYNANLAIIEVAEDCNTVDEAFAVIEKLVNEAKENYLIDIILQQYLKYYPTLLKYNPEAAAQFNELFQQSVLAITYEFDRNVKTPYTTLIDDVNEYAASMPQYCAFAELYNITVLPEVDADEVNKLYDEAFAAISATYDEYELGLAIVNFRAALAKLTVVEGVPLDEDVAEAERAIDRVYAAYLAELAEITTLEELKEFFATELTSNMIYARDNYAYFNFLYDYADILALTEDTVTLADVEAILEALEAGADAWVEDDELIAELVSKIEALDNLVASVYVEAFLDAVAKADDTDDRKAEIEYYAEMIDGAYAVYAEDAYKYALVAMAVYDKYNDTVAALEALKVEGNDVLNAIIDAYLARVYAYDSYVDEYYADINVQKEQHFAFYDRELTIAESEVDFLAKKAATKAELEAMKNNSAAVDAIVDKYLADLNKVVYKYNNVGADVDAYNAAAIKSLSNIKTAAETETVFEKARAEAIEAVKADAAAKKASGKYSEDQIKQLESKLNAAVAALGNLYVENGNDVAEIEATKAAALADLASVEISNIVVGTPDVVYPDGYKYENGLWATVTNANGMNSALNVVINFVSADGKELAEKFDVEGVMTNEQATVAVDGKEIVFAFDIKFSDAALVKDDNGFYTVKLRTPAEVKKLTGICVMAEGEGVNYVFETTVDGDYIIFKTNKIGSTHVIVADEKVDLTWLIVVLVALIVIEGIVIIFFISKMKKGNKVASFAPFLAVLFTPAGVVPAIAVLGAVTALGAIAATATTFTALKKKAN